MNMCKNCKKETEGKRIYCSLQCRNIFVNKNLRDYSKMHSTLKQKLDESIQIYLGKPNYCKICNNILAFEDKHKITCSEKCRKVSVANSNKTRNNARKAFSAQAIENITNARRKNEKVLEAHINYDKNLRYCKECGKELSFKRRNFLFCSIECKNLNYLNSLSEYQKYHRDCQFDFALSDYPDKFDFNLLEKFGCYKAKNRGDNPNGISRDHMISIRYGFINNIDSSIIKHPANCNLMRHNDNVRKFTKCSISLEELIQKINAWDEK